MKKWFICVLIFLLSGVAFPEVQKKILVLITGARQMVLSEFVPGSLRREETGYFLVELGEVLRQFEQSGFSFVFATPDGSVPLIDVNSLELTIQSRNPYHALFFDDGLDGVRTDHIDRILEHMGAAEISSPWTKTPPDAKGFALSMLKKYPTKVRYHAQRNEQYNPQTKNLVSFNQALEVLDEVAGVYVPGGHGPVVDMLDNVDLGRLFIEALNKKLPLGLVCHAPLALVSTVKATLGKSYVNLDPGDQWPFKGAHITIANGLEEWLALNARYGRDGTGWLPIEFKRLHNLVDDRARQTGMSVIPHFPGLPAGIYDPKFNLTTGANPASALVGVPQQFLINVAQYYYNHTGNMLDGPPSCARQFANSEVSTFGAHPLRVWLRSLMLSKWTTR